MREKLFAVFMILLTLAVTFNLWFTRQSEVKIYTDLEAKTKVVLQYQKKPTSKELEEKAKVFPDGSATFYLKGSTIYRFNIQSPQNVKIKNVRFKGLKKQYFSLNEQNEYVGDMLKGGIHINWYNFIILIGLGYYLSWFLIYWRRNGFPQDEVGKPKMQNIEFLRIVFTLVILLFHIHGMFHYFSKGRYAVEFFFILSGFFFALTYDRAPTVIDFIKRKFIRFTPAIIFCSIACGISKTNIDFSTLSADWLFWSNTGLFNGDSYTIAAWYISVLFWVTLLYFYLLKNHRKETVYALIGVLTFLAYAACVRFGFGRLNGLGDKGNIGYMITLSMMRGVGGIGLGFFLAQFYMNRDQEKMRFKTWQYTIAELALLIMPCLSMFYKPMLPTNLMLLVVSYAALIYLFLIKKGHISRFFDKPIFSKLSRYTLIIYVSHQPVTIPFLEYLGVSPSLFDHKIFGIVVYIMAFCLVGAVIHHVIEIPMSRAMKKIMN